MLKRIETNLKGGEDREMLRFCHIQFKHCAFVLSDPATIVFFAEVVIKNVTERQCRNADYYNQVNRPIVKNRKPDLQKKKNNTEYCFFHAQINLVRRSEIGRASCRERV